MVIIKLRRSTRAENVFWGYYTVLNMQTIPENFFSDNVLGLT